MSQKETQLATATQIHVRIVPFGKQTIERSFPLGTTVEAALQSVGKSFDRVTVRVGGKTTLSDTPLQDGQIVTTDIPRIVVG